MIELHVPSVGAVMLPGEHPVTGSYTIREDRVTIKWDDGIDTHLAEAAFVQLVYAGRMSARPDIRLVLGG